MHPYRFSSESRTSPVGLAEARKKARELLNEVLGGRDPIEEAKRHRLQARGPKPTSTEEAIQLYGRTALKDRRSCAQILSILHNNLDGLATQPVASLTTAQLAAIIDKKAAAAPIAANRLVSALKPFCRWAKARGHSDVDAAVDLHKPSRERSRDRVLTADELRSILTSAALLGQPWNNFVLLLLLTAQRREEVAGMRWTELNIKASQWELAAARTKTGNAHLVHLSDMSLSVLLPMSAERKGDFVFTTTGRTPVSGFSKMKARLDAMCGVNDWRLHDFRRTFATIMADNGVEAIVADRVLNHVGAGTQGTVQRVYQRSELLPQRRNALDIWGKWIADLSSQV